MIVDFVNPFVNTHPCVDEACLPAYMLMHATGTYFGGTVKRPQFPNAKGRIQLTRKADTEAQTAVARAAPEPTKTAAWDAWTSPAEEEEGTWLVLLLLCVDSCGV